MALAALILSSISTAALAVEIREPSPSHVWEAAEDQTSAALGTPDTDDIVLTLACNQKGSIDVIFANYTPMPESKQGDSGPAGITLRRVGKELSLKGSLVENVSTGEWDVSVQQP